MRWLRSLRKARRELRVRVACAVCGALLGAVLATTSMAALLRYLRTLPQPRGRVPSFPDHNAAENQIERLRITIIMSAPALARCLLTRSADEIEIQVTTSRTSTRMVVGCARPILFVRSDICTVRGAAY
jgi:hypothetical protein